MKTLEEILKYTQQEGECLVWTRCFNTDGYPRMAWKGSTNGKTHRIVCELSTGEDLTGWVVRHTCDNPRCINPNHLIKGTPSDNMADRDSRGRQHRVISNETILEVKKLLEEGIKQKDIADLLGIDPRRVSDVHNGRYDKRRDLL